MMFGIGPLEIFIVLLILGFLVAAPFGVFLVLRNARGGSRSEGGGEEAIHRAQLAADAGPVCWKCYAAVPVGAHFCGQCGAAIGPPKTAT